MGTMIAVYTYPVPTALSMCSGGSVYLKGAGPCSYMPGDLSGCLDRHSFPRVPTLDGISDVFTVKYPWHQCILWAPIVQTWTSATIYGDELLLSSTLVC